MHYFIIAGESSGDLHGSRLIEELRAQDSNAVVTFIGGDKMSAVAGQAPLIHCRDMAYMSFASRLSDSDRLSFVQSQSGCDSRQNRNTRILLYLAQDLGLEKMANTRHTATGASRLLHSSF